MKLLVDILRSVAGCLTPHVGVFSVDLKCVTFCIGVEFVIENFRVIVLNLVEEVYVITITEIRSFFNWPRAFNFLIVT